jgi:quercetin dioxygenase-like cupin family protein
MQHAARTEISDAGKQMSVDQSISVERSHTAGYAAIAAGLVAGVGALLLSYHLAGTRSPTGTGLHGRHLSTAQSPTALPRPTVTVVSSEYLPHVPGKKITTVLLEFPPAAFSPKHHHGGSVSVYVLSGTIRSQLEGGPIGTFKAGEMFFEPPGITHVFAENASSSDAARALAMFVHDEGAVLTTYHE